MPGLHAKFKSTQSNAEMHGSQHGATPENDDPSKYQENMTYNKEECQPEWSELTQMLELARKK